MTTTTPKTLPDEATTSAMRAILFSGRIVDTAMIHDLYRAALAAQPPAVAAIPEGWKLVPIEATPEMIEAGTHVKRMRLLKAVEATRAGKDHSKMAIEGAEGEYRAMIAAAPHPLIASAVMKCWLGPCKTVEKCADEGCAQAAPATSGEATAAQGAEWFPIETAPKGKLGYSWMLLAWGPEEDQSISHGMRWGDKFFATGICHCLGRDKRFEFREIEVKPTHWMPLPAPPSPAAPGNGEGGNG